MAGHDISLDRNCVRCLIPLILARDARMGGATERGRDAREAQTTEPQSPVDTFYCQPRAQKSNSQARARWGRTLELNKGLISSASSYQRKSFDPSDPENKQFSGRWRNRPELPGVWMEQARTESPGARRPADQPPVKPRTGERGSILQEHVKRRHETSSISGCFYTICIFSLKYDTKSFPNQEYHIFG